MSLGRELVLIAADRWVLFEADSDAPRGYVYALEALEPAGLGLYSAVLADGVELGIYRKLSAAVEALEDPAR